MTSLMSRMSPSITNMIRMDHTHVVAAFHQFQADTAPRVKKGLADNICLALEVHAQLEEEIFYPALREVPGAGELLDEAEAEHQEAKELIAQIEGLRRAGEEMDDLVSKLAGAIEHHVKEERTQIFPKARASSLDLEALGQQLKERQQQLEAQVA